MGRRTLIASALSSLLASVTAGFASAFPEDPPRFVRLTHEQGLSDNTVTAIAEDHRGFMWFGTEGGLNRYDAHTFVTYRHDPDDPASLGHNVVRDLLADRQGTLWIASAGGVDVYDPASDSFEHMSTSGPDGAAAVEVYALHEDREGTLWAGAYQGLYRIDPTRRALVPVVLDLPDGEGVRDVRSIVMVGSGELWIGTVGWGLVRWDPRGAGRAVRYRAVLGEPGGLADDHVFDLYEDRRGNLWIGTRGGLHLRRAGEDGFTALLADPEDPGSISSDHVVTVFEDGEGRLWIGTDGGGLVSLDRDTGTFTAYRYEASDDTSPGSDSVRSIYEDELGDLWIGTFAGGIGFLNRASAAFAHVRHHPDDPASLSHNGVLSFLEEDGGTLWIGTEGGLDRLEPPSEEGGACTFTVYRHDPRDPRSLAADAVLTLLEDRERRFWVGTYYGGLNRLDRASGTFTRYVYDSKRPGSLRNPHVWDLAEDLRGRLWVATLGGLHRFEPETETFAFYGGSAAGGAAVRDVVWKLYVDSAGVLWLGTNHGLQVWDPVSDRLERFRPDGPELSRQVLTILEDREGRMWLGTAGGGLLLFDRESETFSPVAGSEAVASNIVSLLEDDHGRLWLATSDGLSRFDPRQRRFVHYDDSDGLLAFPFIRDAALESSGGRLYFGGIHGFVSFDPDEIRENTRVPPIVLTGFEIFNKPVAVDPGNGPLYRDVSMTEEICLDHDDSVFTLSWAGLSYRGSARNRYAYMLENFDSGWTDAGTKRSATYTNLDPGEYVFRVKGSNSSGVWNEEGASVRIEVLPPFWATWWFRCTLALTVAGLLLGAYLVLKSKNDALARKNTELEAKNVELERFTYTVSHDLKAPLVTIKGFLGLARRDAERGDTKRLESDLGHIDEAADKMHQLVTRLLDLSRVGRQVHPHEEVALAELARGAARWVDEKGNGGAGVIEVDPEMPTVRGDKVRLEEAFQNLLGNALKFMGDQPNPRVEVGGHLDGDEVLCWVRDNGKGIDARYCEKVFGLFERLDADEEGTGIGLALVRRIVELHGGRIWVESEGAGKGCTFWFTLPREP